MHLTADEANTVRAVCDMAQLLIEDHHDEFYGYGHTGKLKECPQCKKGLAKITKARKLL